MPILVVDDNAELAEAVAEILRGEFPEHGLDVGYDGLHALRLAGTRRPHVVVMDLEMPTMGGVQSASEMRRRMRQPPRLTLIAMSGNLVALDSNAARSAFDHLLPKPLDFGKLIALVAAA